MNDKVYAHEDVFTRPHQIADYQANQGTWWSFSPELRYDLVGIFGQLRPAGRWPRAVNLWEMDWWRLEGALNEQFADNGGTVSDAAHNEWFRKSAGHRSGGFDRFMRPGPDSPPLADLQTGPARPCVVQLNVAVRLGAKYDYLAWVNDELRPAAEQTEQWRTLMWLGALHGSSAVVYLGAPSWDGLVELGRQLPAPRAEWEVRVETSLLSTWAGSGLLLRDHP